MKIEMLEAKHLARAPHAALHFVRDQKNSMLTSELLETRQEIGRRNDVAAFTLDRLHDDRGNFARIDGRLENHVLQIVDVSVWEVSHAGNERSEFLPLNRLR